MSIVDYKTKLLEYSYQDTQLEAFIARPNKPKANKPAVLICHAWAGRDQFVADTACQLAELGYVGVALDVYGKGVLGGTVDKNMALMQPLLDNRQELQGRLAAGLDCILNLEYVNSSYIAAIGYCFGGLCVLDMARMGLNLKGVISIHGLFNKPDNLSNYKINSKILALHGHLDPMVTPQAVTEFTRELDVANADWQINIFGKALHAFTNPNANDHNFGTVYNSMVAKTAWGNIKQFLNECLSL